MIRQFTICTVALAFAVSAMAATPADTATAAMLRHQADAWDEAIILKDRKAIESNMAVTFMQIGSDGAKADKAEFVAALMDQRLTIAPYKVQDFQVRIYGNTALLTGTTDMHGSWNGKPFTSNYRYTDVYIRQNGKWRVVNVQTTSIK